MNRELPDGQAGFRKGRGIRDPIATIYWIIVKAWEFQKNIHLCFIDYAKAFDCVITTDCGKFWKRWEYQTTWPASWEICMQVKKQLLELDMGCILSPCLFNLYAEYIMRNAGLDEAQAGIKIARRNINYLRYADDTTLIAEKWRTKEPLDESEKGELKSWLKAQHSEN